MKVSIRWALILGFLGLIWGTHLITTTSSFVTSQRVLNRHAQDIMSNIAELAMEQAQNHLAHAHVAAALTKRLLSTDVVSSDKSRRGSLERYFHDQLTIYPYFAGIYLGLPNGDFYDVRRDDSRTANGFRTKFIVHRNGVRQVRLIYRDAAFTRLSEHSDPKDTYDPRERPWYQKALAFKQIVWTDPYIFFTSQKPGITIAGPVFTTNGQLRDVVGVDIEIDHLSTFIASLKIGRHGRAFMVNRNGDVIAFPDLAKLRFAKKSSQKSSRLVKIHELDDPLSRKAFVAAGFQLGEGIKFQLNQPRFTSFTHEGRKYLAMFRPFSSPEWPWVICVYLPEADYLGEIKANRRDNIYLTLGISAAATLIGLLLARGIIRPMSLLERDSTAIRENQFTESAPIHSIYKELQVTADSFSHMKSAIKRNQQRYLGIFENIQDVYYEASMRGTILEISPSIERISRYCREELLGTPVSKLYSIPDKREKFIARLCQTGKLNDYEVIFNDKDGGNQYCSLNCTLIRDDHGLPKKIVGSLRVITDRKKAEQELEIYQHHLEDQVWLRTADLEKVNEALRAEIAHHRQTELALRHNEEKYRSILESIQEGYFETNLKGNLTFVNDAASRLLGYEAVELIGMNNRAYTSSATSEKMARTFRHILTTGNPIQGELFTLIRKDGGQRLVEMSISLIRNSAQQAVGFRGVARDITARLQFEDEKQRLEEQLHHAQRMEAIGTLAGGIAHDFNNLLMGIQGNVSLLYMSLEGRAELLESVRTIERCVDSGASLTRQLLGFARGGKYVVTPVDMNDTLMKTSELFGRTKKEIRTHGNYQKGLWTVEADQGQIEQVLVNMYVNAWQAMSERGDLWLSTENVMLGEKVTRPHDIKPGRYVKVTIRDNGHGMDERVRQRIFEPFFTTKKRGRGTGLGLASAFGIIRNHSGTITVESQVNQGSTFYIYLPASDLSMDQPSQDDVQTASGSETILIIDDEPFILTSLREILERLGYQVLTAEGGIAGLEMFETHAGGIDLVILDMIMPDMGGGEVFDRIRELEPRVKVLLASGYSINRLAEEIIERGCNGFIQKPFNLTKLSQQVRMVIAG